jgi:phosphoglycerol transferase MdoB-like AlkP superfamily enzyme
MTKIENERWLELLEGFGVAMRIFSFGMLSIMGKDTPFLTMWVINTIDAALLTYCAIQRGNRPYILMNVFWLIVGLIGIYTSIYGNGINH